MFATSVSHERNNRSNNLNSESKKVGGDGVSRNQMLFVMKTKEGNPIFPVCNYCHKRGHVNKNSENISSSSSDQSNSRPNERSGNVASVEVDNLSKFSYTYGYYFGYYEIPCDYFRID